MFKDHKPISASKTYESNTYSWAELSASDLAWADYREQITCLRELNQLFIYVRLSQTKTICLSTALCSHGYDYEQVEIGLSCCHTLLDKFQRLQYLQRGV